MITALVFESFFAGTPVHAVLFALMRTAHALLVVYFLFLAISDVARHGSYEPLAVYAVGWLAYTLPFTLMSFSPEACKFPERPDTRTKTLPLDSVLQYPDVPVQFPAPVSYTHLDVYKRQMKICSDVLPFI